MPCNLRLCKIPDVIPSLCYSLSLRLRISLHFAALCQVVGHTVHTELQVCAARIFISPQHSCYHPGTLCCNACSPCLLLNE